MSGVTGHARTIQETRAISDQGLDTIIDRAFDETSWNGIVRQGRDGTGQEHSWPLIGRQGHIQSF